VESCSGKLLLNGSGGIGSLGTGGQKGWIGEGGPLAGGVTLPPCAASRSTLAEGKHAEARVGGRVLALLQPRPLRRRSVTGAGAKAVARLRGHS